MLGDRLSLCVCVCVCVFMTGRAGGRVGGGVTENTKLMSEISSQLRPRSDGTFELKDHRQKPSICAHVLEVRCNIREVT